MLKMIVNGYLCVTILPLSFSAYGGGMVADVLKDIGAINEKTARSLDEANRNLKESVAEYKTLEEDSSKEVRDAFKRLRSTNNIAITNAIKEVQKKSNQRVTIAEASVKEVEQNLKEYDSKMKELANLSLEIENERDELKIQKAEIERKAELFSMGFYTSLTTTVVAIFGFVFHLPTAKLDRQLKKLEIEEKQYSLSKVKNGVA